MKKQPEREEDDLLERIPPEAHCMNPCPADALDSIDALLRERLAQGRKTAVFRQKTVFSGFMKNFL